MIGQLLFIDDLVISEKLDQYPVLIQSDPR